MEVKTVELATLLNLGEPYNPNKHGINRRRLDSKVLNGPIDLGDTRRIGLAQDENYRDFLWQTPAINADGKGRWNEFRLCIGRGFIFLDSVKRYSGAHLAEVCQALYAVDHPLETLRCVFAHYVVNNETLPLVENIYNSKRLPWDAYRNTEYEWEWGTIEYQDIMGTQLARAVARFILISFPRGTRRIERIVTFVENGSLMMRFELDIASP